MGMRKARCPMCKKRRQYANLPTNKIGKPPPPCGKCAAVPPPEALVADDLPASPATECPRCAPYTSIRHGCSACGGKAMPT